MNMSQLNVAIVEATQADDFTPYELAGVASKLVGKYVREQMLYQYVAKKFIPSGTSTRATKKGPREVKAVAQADARAWLTKYASKQLNVTADVTADV